MRQCAIGMLLFWATACAGGDRPLQLIAGQGPVYPEPARTEGIEGEVTVRYDVTMLGTVTNARVVASHPPGVFDEAALSAVRSWRFNAPQVDGQPQVAQDRQSTVTFKMGDAEHYDRY